jgi:hypothetical protein
LPAWAKAALLTWFSASFFQFPGIPVGNNSALLPGHLAFPLVLPALLLGRGVLRRFTQCMTAVNVTFLVSWVMHLGASEFSNDFALKGVLCFNSYFVQILGGLLLAACRPREIGAALLIGIGGESLVGAIQYISFANGQFPFASFFNHKAFSEFDSAAQESFARYTQRPFGLFPEPSAMGASLGPWLGYLLGVGLFRKQVDDSPAFKVVTWLTFVLGAALVLVSRTGYALILFPALGLFALCQARGVNLAMIVVAVGVTGLVPQLTSLWGSLADEWHAKQTGSADSWEMRLISARYVLENEAEMGLRDRCFGIGPFNSAAQIAGQTAGENLASMALSLVYENGAVGLGAGVWLLFLCVRSIKLSRIKSTGILMLALWIASAGIGTGYCSLPPLWSAFGLLLNWAAYCEDAGRREDQAGEAPAREHPVPVRLCGGRIP